MNALLHESMKLRGAVLSRTLRSSVRLRSINCVASFLTQGNNACENILRARICTAVRTGAKRAHISLEYCIHSPTDCILPIRYIVNSILGWQRSHKYANK